MSNQTNDTVSFVGLWMTIILSILLLLEQLSANGVIA
jgi:hypothetical protein